MPRGLYEAIGSAPHYVGMSRFDALVQVASESVVRGLTPDMTRLRQVPVRGVIVTARADASSPYDIVSRFFGPTVGIEEDPVTGSAHCCLAPFWARRLGKNDLVAYQASARGGTLRLGLRGDRVKLGGQAVTVLDGQLRV